MGSVISTLSHCPLQVHHAAPQGGVRAVPGHDRGDGGRLGGDRLADSAVDAGPRQHRHRALLQTLPVRLQGDHTADGENICPMVKIYLSKDRPPRCDKPKVCNLWHKSGVRYMRTCQVHVYISISTYLNILSILSNIYNICRSVRTSTRGREGRASPTVSWTGCELQQR